MEDSKKRQDLIDLRGSQTQEDVANAIGISRSYLANIEGGKQPSLIAANSVCRYYKVSLNDTFPAVYEKYKNIFLKTNVPEGDNKDSSASQPLGS